MGTGGLLPSILRPLASWSDTGAAGKRLLCGQNRLLCQLPQLGYAYLGHSGRTVRELLVGHRSSRDVYRHHFRQFPLDCGFLMLVSFFKSAIYRAALSTGLSDWVSTRPSDC